MREAVLKGALDLVPKYGWSRLALEESAKSLGLPATVHGMFKGGEVDLIGYFVERSNLTLQDCVFEQGESMREKLKLVVKKRVECVIPFESTWSDALAILAVPYNVPEGAKFLHQTSDEILHVCGDESTDFSWYTKRGLLSGVVASTELHLITDMTAGKESTWKFLENRLDNYAMALQTCSQITKLSPIKF
jgi:ubiquinone biosynthesis protein COQ9